MSKMAYLLKLHRHDVIFRRSWSCFPASTKKSLRLRVGRSVNCCVELHACDDVKPA